jgi:imidazolonepropionase-like amidohydrolase
MMRMSAAAGAAAFVPTLGLAQQGTPQPVLIRGARIFDGSSPDLLDGLNVLIEGGRISRLAADVEAPGEAREIDADGRVLMPGLIDAHWHAMLATTPLADALNSDFGYLMLVAQRANEDALMRGFTSVRDLGGNVFGLHRATDAGLVNGPRMYPCGGMIGQTGGHGDFRPYTAVPAQPNAPLDYLQQMGMTLIADGVPEVIQRCREVLRMGATQLKVHAGGGVSSLYDPLDVTQYTLDEMRAAVEVASTWNTYVTVHAFTDTAIQQAIEAGVSCIEHGHLATEETLRMMLERDVWLSMQPVLNDEDAIPFPEGSESQRKFEEVTAGTERVYTLARELGVKIAFGTDTLFDPTLAEKQGKQLAKLSRWFEPAEVLAQATSRAAELLKLCGPRDPYPGALGVVEEDAHADLILVDGDPLADIDLVADPENNFSMIMKGGVIHKDAV